MIPENEKTLEAKWVVDSETGSELLVDIYTNKVIVRKDSNGIWRIES